MPIAQTLIPEFDEEMASTRRALERVPTGKAAWKPHPKSMPLGRLATLLAELPSWALNAVTLDELDIAPPGGPPFQPVILETGKEILHPLAVVVIGGLVASTLLDQLVTPALFLLYGAGAAAGKERAARRRRLPS